MSRKTVTYDSPYNCASASTVPYITSSSMVPTWQCPHPHYPYKMLPPHPATPIPCNHAPSQLSSFDFSLSCFTCLVWPFWFSLFKFLVSPRMINKSPGMGWLEKTMFCAGYLLFMAFFFFLKQKFARSDRMHFVYKSWITIAELPSTKDFPI